MPDCIFCKIVSGEIPANKIYEDNELLAFLDIKPVNPGHTLVITKKHFTDFMQTPEGLLCQMTNLAKKIGQKIINSGLGQGINITNNIKPAAGQAVDHVHMHVIPRLEGDGYELWHGREYAPGEVEKVVEKLKLEL